jgi:hypothetical protein
MNLTEKEIEAYFFCPLRYRFLYRDHLEEPPSPYSRFEQAARILVLHFFYHTMSGSYPSLTGMKECFERIWYADEPDIQEKLQWRDPSLARKLENKIFDGILKFYEKETNRSFRTLMVEQHFEIPIGEHTLSGCLDVIRDIGKQVEIISVRPVLSPYAVTFDTVLTVSSFAFRHLYAVKEDLLTAYFFPGCREINTKRKRDSYRGLLGLLDYLAGEPAFYPRYNSDCHRCGFRDRCSLWPVS